MSKETERATILSHVKANWPATLGPLSWPNVKFEIPSTGVWTTVRLNDYGSIRTSLGRSYLKKNLGSLQFDLYFPRDIGSSEYTKASDILEGIYDTLELITSDRETVVFETPSSRNLSDPESREDRNERWFRRVVDCPYYRNSVGGRK